jgi:hypothetical protein
LEQTHLAWGQRVVLFCMRDFLFLPADWQMRGCCSPRERATGNGPAVRKKREAEAEQRILNKLFFASMQDTNIN